MYAATLRLFMVNSLLVLSSVSRRCDIVSSMGSLLTNYFPLVILQTSPIPFGDSSIAPVNVVGCGLISLKWLGFSARIRYRHRGFFCAPVKLGALSFPQYLSAHVVTC